MKYQIIAITLLTAILLSSCEKEDPVPAPIADFTVANGVLCSIGTIGTVVLADQTSVQFQNNSSGEIDSYHWEFEDGLTTSTSENPNHIFDFEGIRNVILTVSGSGGSDSKSCAVRVLAFPSCDGFTEVST